jgi:hypothetical protein
MMPELVTSANDFLFSLCVVELTGEVRSINEVLKLKKLDCETMNKVNKVIKNHLEVSSSLKQFFSPRLFVTLLYNLVQLTIALYWIFIRIAHNHFNKIEGYASFIYIVQPSCCLFAVFGSVHGYVKQVRRLPRSNGQTHLASFSRSRFSRRFCSRKQNQRLDRSRS